MKYLSTLAAVVSLSIAGAVYTPKGNVAHAQDCSLWDAQCYLNVIHQGTSNQSEEEFALDGLIDDMWAFSDIFADDCQAGITEACGAFFSIQMTIATLSNHNTNHGGGSQA